MLRIVVMDWTKSSERLVHNCTHAEFIIHEVLTVTGQEAKSLQNVSTITGFPLTWKAGEFCWRSGNFGSL